MSLALLEVAGDLEILKVAAKVAGIGGFAIGSVMIVFRDIIRKNIFPNLLREQAYRLLLVITVLMWTIALAGIGAWVYVRVVEAKQPNNVSSSLSEYVIEGKVLDGNKPIKNAQVMVKDPPATDTTTNDGKFRVAVKLSKPSEVRLQIRCDGFSTWEGFKRAPSSDLTVDLASLRMAGRSGDGKVHRAASPRIIDEKVERPTR